MTKMNRVGPDTSFHSKYGLQDLGNQTTIFSTDSGSSSLLAKLSPKRLFSLKCMFVVPLMTLVCVSCISVWLVTFLLGYRYMEEDAVKHMSTIVKLVSKEIDNKLMTTKHSVKNVRKSWYMMTSFDDTLLFNSLFREVYVLNASSTTMALTPYFAGSGRYYNIEQINDMRVFHYQRHNETVVDTWKLDFRTGKRVQYKQSESFSVVRRVWYILGLASDPFEGKFSQITVSPTLNLMSMYYVLPVYNFTVPDDIGLYNQNTTEIAGVVKSTISLSDLHGYLTKLTIVGNGFIVITENNFNLITASTHLPLDINIRRISALNSTIERIDVVTKARRNAGKDIKGVKVRIRGKTFLVHSEVYRFDNVEWIIIVGTEQLVLLSGLLKSLYTSLSICASIFFICILFGVTGAFFVNRAVSRVSNSLKEKMKLLKHARFQYVETPPQSYFSELRTLEVHFKKMEVAIMGFMKYVPADVVRSFIGDGLGIRAFAPGVKPRDIAILFTDIVDFTSICEIADPSRLVEMMSLYFELLGSTIAKHHGTLDKYIGDAILVLFNCPNDLHDFARYACACGLDMVSELKHLNNHFESLNWPRLETKVGIHTGACLVGNIGSSYRLAYTALGDAVNTASRIEGANRIYGTNVLISDDCYNRVKDHFVCRILDRVRVKGKSKVTGLYELVGEAHTTSQESLHFVEAYNNVMEKHYFKKDFGTTISQLAVINTNNDKAAEMILSRCRNYIASPPDSWDGSVQLTSK